MARRRGSSPTFGVAGLRFGGHATGFYESDLMTWRSQISLNPIEHRLEIVFMLCSLCGRSELGRVRPTLARSRKGLRQDANEASVISDAQVRLKVGWGRKRRCRSGINVLKRPLFWCRPLF